MSKEIPRYLSRKNQQSRSTHATMSKSQKRSPHWNLALRDHLPLSGGATRGFNHLKTLLPTATPTRQHLDRKPCRLWRWQGRIRIQTCWTLQLQMQQPTRERKQLGAVALQLERRQRLLWQLCPPPGTLKEDVAHGLWWSAISSTLFPVRVKRLFPCSSQPTEGACPRAVDNTGQIVGHHTLQRLG